MEDLAKQLQAIQCLVLDEDLIVTYKYVSQALQVHTNTAKQLLFAFSELPKVASQINTIYLIGGEREEKAGFKFLLVKSNEVENIRQKFKNISIEHVYSVQRAADISGTDLYNANQHSDYDIKFSSIQGGENITRREVPKYIPFVPKKEVKEVKKDVKEVEKDNKPNKGEPFKPVQKKEVATENSSPVKHVKKSPKKQPTKKGNIGAMFIRQASMAKPKVVKEEEKDSKENIQLLNNQEPEKKEPKEKQKNTDKELKETKQKEIKEKNTNSKKRKKSKNNDSKNKSRKRIKVASDSESSGEEMDYEEAPPTPEQEALAEIASDSEEDIIPATPIENKKKRVRKQVDTVFVDDDGFMITKKEYKYESCEDDEEVQKEAEKVESKKPKTDDVEPTEDKSPNAVKKQKKTDKVENKKETKSKKGAKAQKQTSPQKSRQTSIMSFFKNK